MGNCLLPGPAPACYDALPATAQPMAATAHASGMAYVRPQGSKPLDFRTDAKWSCTRTCDNKKCDAHPSCEGRLAKGNAIVKLIAELGGCDIRVTVARSALSQRVVPDADRFGEHGVKSSGVSSRTPGGSYDEKLRSTSGSLECVIEDYRFALPKLGLTAPPLEQLYSTVRGKLGTHKYFSFADLHTPGAVGHAEAFSRHQAQEGAKKGNQGDVSGTSGFGFIFEDCPHQTPAWGSLNYGARSGGRALLLSLPWHGSYSCRDPSCPVLQEFRVTNNSQRWDNAKCELADLLDAAFDGGAPVSVTGYRGGKKTVLIRPLQRINDF